MECVQKSETKRKRTTDFTENAKKQRSWRERDTEMDKQRTTTLIDADDNTGDGIESSRCNHADGNMVSKANKEVVDPEADAERDQRTVYVSGIPLRASMEEVNIFFSSVCKVRKIDLILDPSLRVPKAVGYIEFDDPIYVPMAIDLSGQLLRGLPIEVKPLNVGNPSAGERSYIHTGKKNFLDKPRYLMTSDERIDASTNWRELTDVENRRCSSLFFASIFFYNMVTGDRRWEIPQELAVARNQAREAARISRIQNPVSTHHVPFSPLVTAPSNCQQVSAVGNMMTWSSQAYPWPPYQFYPFVPFPQYLLPHYQ
ncbi:uncharacterized protein LOC131323432 isoform X2 [Rhododendron vialii]|uniref:uncharacterized protein LOC131323432 isoform X2 n=1 Tax=Rhododendron vialii TaxID=182163 RepID=UPI00265DF049|nr:uncharacterized protein LOC131323432 isoform X2 [Rhododendron vialii]